MKTLTSQDLLDVMMQMPLDVTCKEIVMTPYTHAGLKDALGTIHVGPMIDFNSFKGIKLRIEAIFPEDWLFVFRMTDGTMEVIHRDGTTKKGLPDVYAAPKFPTAQDLLCDGNHV